MENMDEVFAQMAGAAVPRQAVAFGKLSISEMRYRIVEKTSDGGWEGRDVEVKEYTAAQPVRNQLFKTVEPTFLVDVQEFNPDLQWQYERRVQINDPDWKATVAPSIEAIYGGGSAVGDGLRDSLSKLVGSYVEVQDEPQVGDPAYNTINFVRVFESRDACYAAYVERFGEPGGDGAGAAGVGLSDDEEKAIKTLGQPMLDIGGDIELVAKKVAEEVGVTPEQAKSVLQPTEGDTPLPF